MPADRVTMASVGILALSKQIQDMIQKVNIYIIILKKIQQNKSWYLILNLFKGHSN